MGTACKTKAERRRSERGRASMRRGKMENASSVTLNGQQIPLRNVNRIFLGGFFYLGGGGGEGKGH